MPWYFGYTLVSRVCLGMLGILWYALYPLVSRVCFGILDALWYFLAERGLSSRSSGIWTALNRSVDEKKYTAHPPPTTHHPTNDTRCSPVYPPNFWSFFKLLNRYIFTFIQVATQFLGYHFDFYGVPPKKGGWGDMCNSRVFVDFPLTKVITIRLNWEQDRKKSRS